MRISSNHVFERNRKMVKFGQNALKQTKNKGKCNNFEKNRQILMPDDC